MLFRSCPDSESRNVDELAAHTDVALLDEHSCVVDRLGKPLLVDLGLEAAFQELLGGKLENEIEFELIVSQESVATHSAEEGGTFEDALGILGIQSQKSSGSLSQLGEGVLNTPDFALAAETVLSDELELSIKTFLLVRTTWCLECLAVCVGQERKRQRG